MSTVSKPLIAVTGATGAQGGSVVNFLLKDGSFRIRALTRKPESPKAKELAAKGVEVVRADFDDPSTLAQALKNVYGVFGVTNFWEPGVGAEKEVIQGKALVDAAKSAGVKHFVWSTLEHTSSPTVVHWDSKADVDDYLKASGVPRTSLYTVMYYESFKSFFPLTKSAEGQLEAKWPLLQTDGPLAGFAVSDIGAYVLEILKKPNEWIGKDFKLIADTITARDVVNALRELSGKPIKLHEVSAEAFESLKGAPGLEDIWSNLKWFYLANGNPGRDFELTKRVYPQTLTFKQWAKEHLAELIPQ